MDASLLFLDLGFQEMFVIMVVALLLYGGRLPEVARSLGRTVGEIRRQALGLTREFRMDLNAPPPRVSPTLREIHDRLGSIARGNPEPGRGGTGTATSTASPDPAGGSEEAPADGPEDPPQAEGSKS